MRERPGVRIHHTTNVGDMGVQVQFIDVNNGWASVYNTQTKLIRAYTSTNGGNNWSVSSDQIDGFFSFIDVNNGWLLSGGPDNSPPHKIMKTTDGGANWFVQYTDDTSGGFTSLQFTDLNNGWVSGDEGKILKTTDGGSNWTSITNAGINGYDAFSLFFLDENIGWIGSESEGGGNYIVVHTADGGANWVTQDVPATEEIYSIFFWDINNGWYTAYGTIGRYYP